MGGQQIEYYEKDNINYNNNCNGYVYCHLC